MYEAFGLMSRRWWPPQIWADAPSLIGLVVGLAIRLLLPPRSFLVFELFSSRPSLKTGPTAPQQPKKDPPKGRPLLTF